MGDPTPRDLTHALERLRTHDGNGLDNETLAVIRRAAVDRMQNEGASPAQLAKEYGLNRSTLYRWKDLGRQNIEDALAPGKEGRAYNLSPEDRQILQHAVLSDPRDLGLPHPLWTRTLLTDFVDERVNVQVYGNLVRRTLRLLGLWPQQGPPTHRQQCEHAVDWLAEEYDIVRAEAKEADAPLYFVQVHALPEKRVLMSLVKPLGDRRFFAIFANTPQAPRAFVERMECLHSGQIFLICDPEHAPGMRDLAAAAHTSSRLVLIHLPPSGVPPTSGISTIPSGSHPSRSDSAAATTQVAEMAKASAHLVRDVITSDRSRSGHAHSPPTRVAADTDADAGPGDKQPTLKLTPMAVGTVLHAVINDPRVVGLSAGLWSRTLVERFLADHVGLRVPSTTVARLLRDLHLWPEHSPPSHLEQAGAADGWLETTFKDIRENAWRVGAQIRFARITPLPYKRQIISMMSTKNRQWDFAIVDDTLTDLTHVMHRVSAHYRSPVVLIADPVEMPGMTELGEAARGHADIEVHHLPKTRLPAPGKAEMQPDVPSQIINGVSSTQCNAPWCTFPQRPGTNEWCVGHFRRIERFADVCGTKLGRRCVLLLCPEPVSEGQLCLMHQVHVDYNGHPGRLTLTLNQKGQCVLDDCDQLRRRRGLCRSHYDAYCTHHDPYRTRRDRDVNLSAS
ncbi:helix-turn-helix domain-containing protein [Nonomuraea sp. NPDC046802]|uniref:helix-turn-helix domain-containing protein n=1 Tax=Nonomuraea sp. NPDC046802 TaxID=3154919 RepID=UPI0033F5EA30